MGRKGWSDAARKASLEVRRRNKMGSRPEGPPTQPKDDDTRFMQRATQKDEIPRHRYSGKTMILYHRTSPKAAAKIRDKGFNNVTVFASTRPSGDANSYGKAVIAFKAPRKHVAYEEPAAEGERWVSVNPRNTQVIKRRRKR